MALAVRRGNPRFLISLDGGLGLIYNIALVTTARLIGRPVLLYHHSTNYVLRDSALMRRLLKIAGATSPQVFCSKKMAELFEVRYGPDNCRLIVSNAAWVETVPVGDGSSGGLRLGYLSALTTDKGLGRAIDTLRLLRRRGLTAELLIAGSGGGIAAQRLLTDAVAELGPALVICGTLAGARKWDFYRNLDIFLFPSLYPHETQSLVVPEAMAAGTPVVAYDHRFVGELVGVEGGLLVPLHQDFAAAAVDYIAAGCDGQVRRERRARARRTFLAEQAEAARQFDDLVAWALNRGPK